MTSEPGWTNPPARPTIELGGLAVWLLDAEAGHPLETVAARYLGVAVDEVSIVRTMEGKPVVEGATLEVNLAHSGSVALVAVARQGVGVDVEQLRAEVASWSLPTHALSPAELARVEAAPDPARAFLDLWTRKEALLKAIGLGLAVDPRAIELDVNGKIAALPSVMGPPVDWTLVALPLEGYVAAVAVRGERPVEIFLYGT